jgi:hypothetical protein
MSSYHLVLTFMIFLEGHPFRDMLSDLEALFSYFSVVCFFLLKEEDFLFSYLRIFEIYIT